MKKKLIITESQFKKLKEKLIIETKFNWDGKYANENIGDDIELPLDEELDTECGCSLKQPNPTDVDKSQWFSKIDGERNIDNIMN